MNHQKIIETSLLTLLTGCALLAFSSPGLATDYKIMPGATCKPHGTTDSANFSYTHDGIKNISLVSRVVICPLVKDSDLIYDGTNPATLTIKGKTEIQAVSCTVQRHLASYTKGPIYSPFNTTYDWWTVTFDGYPLNDTNSATGGAAMGITLTCLLPPGGSIRDFTLKELNTES